MISNKKSMIKLSVAGTCSGNIVFGATQAAA